MCAGKSNSQLEIGYKSHMLTVVSDEIAGCRNPPTPVKYETICDCGTVSLKKKQDLISGRVKSCGCVNKVNLIGLKFNKLTVLSVNHIEKYVDRSGTSQTIKHLDCLCDCGKETTLRQSALGRVKSCGCQQTLANKLRIEDISGEIFGRLTAQYRDEKTGKWVCSCECGGQRISKLASLRNGDSKSCGCLQKEKASISISNQHREKRRSRGLPEDIPMQNQYALDRLEFKPLSSEIMKRDLFTCAWCSQKAGRLNVHHLQTWMESTELRFTRSNLVTLCIPCHKKVHKDGNTKPVDPVMTILLQGYVNQIEEGYFDKYIFTPN